jgi:protein-tyrosine phosphatase
MIDLHSHILPGVDDGPRDLQGSLEMARVAVEDGITRLAATPHNADWRDGGRRAWVEERVEELQNALDAQGIPLSVVPGVEAYIAPDLVQHLKDERAFTLNGSRYLLIELPMHSWPLYTEQVFFEVQVQGLVPILAHAARYAPVQEDPNRVFGLVERGALVQLTAGSLTGQFGRRTRDTARRLLEHNLAHLIASDSHSARSRPPRLSPGVEAATRIIGPERARAMVTTVPAAILEDDALTIEPPKPVKPRRRWFWR